VGLKSTTTPFNRKVVGLCSQYFSSLNPCDVLRAKIQKGSLKFPSSNVPVILVATGTGLAPFISFLQHRFQQPAA